MPRPRRQTRAIFTVAGFGLSAAAILLLALRAPEAGSAAQARGLDAVSDEAASDAVAVASDAPRPADGDEGAGGAPGSAAPTSTEPPPGATEADRATGTVTLAFAGDVHAERQIAARLDAGEDVLAGVRDVLSAADVAVVNLETPVGTAGRAAEKSYSFQAPVSLLDALVDAGVDVVSVGNNHALDRGVVGLRETLAEAAARGLATVGGGEDAAAAYAPHVVEEAGLRVAIVGLSRVFPVRTWAAGASSPGLASGYDVARSIDAVRAARAVADHVVVVVHWGTERSPCPDTSQVQLAEALHGAGATVVVGAHPHVFQGIARPRPDQLTAYSLGNFLWYTAGEESGLTGVLTVTLDARGVGAVVVTPARIGGDGSPQPATEADADRLDAAISTRVPGAGCPSEGVPRE